MTKIKTIAEIRGRICCWLRVSFGQSCRGASVSLGHQAPGMSVTAVVVNHICWEPGRLGALGHLISLAADADAGKGSLK